MADRKAHQDVASVVVLPDNNERGYNFLDILDSDNPKSEPVPEGPLTTDTFVDDEFKEPAVQVELPGDFSSYLGYECTDPEPIEVGPGGSYWSTLRGIYPSVSESGTNFTENELFKTIESINTDVNLHPYTIIDFAC